MSRPSAFFKSLEALVHGGRLKGWELATGEAFALVQPYLMPVEGIAKQVACERTFQGHACAYRIVEHGDGTVVGVCDEGECERKVFRREELARFALDESRLASELISLFGLTPAKVELAGPGRSMRLGLVGGRRRVPVVLSRQGGSDVLTRFLADSFAEAGGPLILCVPTDRRVDEQVLRMLEAHESRHFVLDGNVHPTPEGLRFTPQGQDGWHELVGRLNGGGSTVHGFSAPAGAGWHDLTLKFKDGHTLTARLGEQAQQFSFHELGMADNRTKGPDAQWELLLLFAEQMGIFTWQSKGASTRNKKRKVRLARKLKDFFGLPGEPFRYRKEDGGWETVFNIEGF